MNETAKAMNRLQNEKSPYLLQHADNPVDWYPWGDEAFEKARAEDKPILVSVGYSTCHWCHVMAEESFSDPEIAELMNQYFVNIKVDREERPDIDEIYISAVSAMSGSAGWPLNVFLTPEGKPFFGGTYFPPRQRVSPAWRDVLEAIHQGWNNPEKRQQILESAGKVTEVLKTHLSGQSPSSPGPVQPSAEALDYAVETISGMYDPQAGGFSKAPKFPMAPMLDFLLFYDRFSRLSGRKTGQGAKAARMATHTLEKMADGGIHDHIGGGFHRYSTDGQWHVPHFEKMLYDNAQLIGLYLDAYETTGQNRFAEVARACLAYVLRDMTHPEGGFYSAEDADSVYYDLGRPDADAPANSPEKAGKKREGGFYVWRYAELETLLGGHNAAVFAHYYGAKNNGNVASDPMEEFGGKNILYRARTLDDTAGRFDLSVPGVSEILEKSRQILFEARQNRPRPHLDDKVIVEWNGLMISALAKAYRSLGDDRYLAAAENAVRFIYEKLYDNQGEPQLYRRWRDGESKVSAMAGDYAFLVQALLDTYEAGFAPWILEWAISLADDMADRFYDAENGGFYATYEEQDRHLIFHVKDSTDNVIPSAASVATLNLIRLYRQTGQDRFHAIVEQTLTSMQESIDNHPAGVVTMLVAQGTAMLAPVEVVVSGQADAANAGALIDTVRSCAGEAASLIRIATEADRDRLAGQMGHLAQMPVPAGEAAAYVCCNQTCQAPVSDSPSLKKAIEEALTAPLQAI
ncbi:MAG: thioredoxin domain-containing protein [Thermodesulfobacteriota bacterium]